MEQQSTQSSCQCKGKKKSLFFTLAFCFAFGNALAGWFIAHGIYNARMGDRYVSVKGISERIVKSDSAIWDINYKATGDDLPPVNAQIEKNQKDVYAFLNKNGFVDADIELQPTTVIDQYAQEYQSGNKPPQRYIITGGVRVHTDKVDLVRKVSQMTSDLIQSGVVLATKDYLANPRYLFTKLTLIRPAMLKEATGSAHAMAQQFAADSNSQVGAIRHASQGVFQILSADSNAGAQQSNLQDSNDQLTGINKLVRVVTSVDYLLK